LNPCGLQIPPDVGDDAPGPGASNESGEKLQDGRFLTVGGGREGGRERGSEGGRGSEAAHAPWGTGDDMMRRKGREGRREGGREEEVRLPW
jgi:hypothetical protein